MHRVSVIIPCHNEAGSIAAVLAGVRQNLPDAEVIVVDDGSTDGTEGIAREAAGVRVVRLFPNRGKGVALREGMREATGDLFVFLDGDGQDDPADLPRLIEAAQGPRAFVNGSKFLGTIEEGGISRPNYWGNRAMSGLINLLFGARVTDSQSGFRAIARELALSLPRRATEYEIETEMLCRALRMGVAVQEIPVTRRARTAGRTGFRRARNGLRILWTIVRERLRP